ncbi:MAG TPA: hypothetical protein VFM93_09245 [Candidatus Limnocylindria bacterium]|nr:hypothetical protein [Candidatus Limnocylindria bacterium]
MVFALPAEGRLFDERESAVIALARELTETTRLSDATWDRVRAFLDERQLVDLVVNVGLANLNNRFTHAFWTEVPEEAPPA